ncbi:MAG: flagellar protein FlaG [Burkholderiaceae bacterium]
MEIRLIATGSTPAQLAEPTAHPGATGAKPAATPAAVAAADIAVPATAPVPGSAQLAQTVGHLNQAMKTRESGVEFSIDEDSHRTVIKVVDQETKELIRQMPSEEVLEIAKALDRVQGLLINQKA